MYPSAVPFAVRPTLNAENRARISTAACRVVVITKSDASNLKLYTLHPIPYTIA